MSVLQRIKQWWYTRVAPLKLYSARKSDEDIQVIKSSCKIKKMFFEEYKNNPQYTQQDGNDICFKDTRVTKIAPNVFYENISFWNVDFVDVTLENVCFHNCSFHFCKFINMTTPPKRRLIDIPEEPTQGFSCCDFSRCEFQNCSLEQVIFSVGTLKCVNFIDTRLKNTVFLMNSFSQVEFVHNCDLQAFHIFSPSGMFDVRFGENGGTISIDDKSDIGAFRYRHKFNVSDRKADLKVYKIFKKDHYQKVAASYFAFERLFDRNRLLDKASFCFYQRKKAETRSKAIWKAIPGYLAEWCCGYGECPGRAILSLIGVVFLYAPLYMLSGFSTGTRVVKYTLNWDFTVTWGKIIDFCESIYFSFFTLVTVGQGGSSPMGAMTKILFASELLLGAVLITTFTATLFRKITR